MPATEQKINELENALAVMASDIEIILNNIAESLEAIEEADEFSRNAKSGTSGNRFNRAF